MRAKKYSLKRAFHRRFQDYLRIHPNFFHIRDIPWMLSFRQHSIPPYRNTTIYIYDCKALLWRSGLFERAFSLIRYCSSILNPLCTSLKHFNALCGTYSSHLVRGIVFLCDTLPKYPKTSVLPQDTRFFGCCPPLGLLWYQTWKKWHLKMSAK